MCYVGGSITEQKAGWRPRTHEFLNTRFPCDLLGHTAVSASMGNVGSKVSTISSSQTWTYPTCSSLRARHVSALEEVGFRPPVPLSGAGQPCSQWRSAVVREHNISNSAEISSHPLRVETHVVKCALFASLNRAH